MNVHSFCPLDWAYFFTTGPSSWCTSVSVGLWEVHVFMVSLGRQHTTTGSMFAQRQKLQNVKEKVKSSTCNVHKCNEFITYGLRQENPSALLHFYSQYLVFTSTHTRLSFEATSCAQRFGLRTFPWQNLLFGVTLSLSYAKLQLLAVSRPGRVSLRKQPVQDWSPDDIHVVNPKSAWRNSERISLRREVGNRLETHLTHIKWSLELDKLECAAR